MRLENRFTVPADPERAWAFFSDLRNVAQCVPGASTDFAETPETRGEIAVRVGPMNAVYRGQARFVVRDDENKIATIEATGAERGGGTARARVRASLSTVPGGTAVELSTELSLEGRVAHLGRHSVVEVGEHLTTDFAARVAARLDGSDVPGRDVSIDRAPDAPQLPDARDRCRWWGRRPAAAKGMLAAAGIGVLLLAAVVVRARVGRSGRGQG